MSRILKLAVAALFVAALTTATAQNTNILASEPEFQRESPETSTSSFNWNSATTESLRFLTIQHAIRLTQPKTFHELDGPFFGDYVKSIKGLKSWKDGDSSFTNYVAHPMQGAVTGYIQVQNDSNGKTANIADGSIYWKSRLKAMGWSAIYSTQFELGPYSEASIGNVGAKPGTMGYVDLVVTPTGGFGIMVAEDFFDQYVVARLERRTSPAMMRTMRMVFSPNRTLANILRFKKPWRRDNRDYAPRYASDPGLIQGSED